MDVWGLRAAAARHMRRHEEHFRPFVAAEVAGGEEAAGGREEEVGEMPLAASAEWEGESDPERRRFLRHCAAVERTALWGGHLELQALAQALRRHIVVMSADLPDVHLGEEYGGGGEGTGGEVKGGAPPIRLSYHKHAFGLGEHYNSVVPVMPQEGKEQEEGEEEAVEAL